MAGRIRSVKPEWLEDELLSTASSDARVLSIALIVLADDYGNGRAGRLYIAGHAFPGKPLEVSEEALEELADIRFVVLYEREGQRYFAIRNWSKHQRVDKPGRPLVPSMDGQLQPSNPAEQEGFTYIARKGAKGPIKIGYSVNPVQRAEQLSKQQPDAVSILASMPGRKHEKALHRRFAQHKRRGEWFEPVPELLALAKEWASAEAGNGRATDGQEPSSGHEPAHAPDRDRDRDQRPTTTTGTREAPSLQPVVVAPRAIGETRVQIPCPSDLALTPDQVGTLETSGVSSYAIRILTSKFVVGAQADPSDLRTLVVWRKCLSAAITGTWNDRSKRPRDPGDEDQNGETQRARERELTERHEAKLRQQTEEARAQLARTGGAPERDVAKLVGGIGGA